MADIEQILLAERPVEQDAWRDLRVFGKPFSHPFLVLKDAEGAVVSEIHGARYKNPVCAIPGYLLDRFTGAVRHDFLVTGVRYVTGPVYPKAALVSTDGARQYHKAIVLQPVFSGSSEEVRQNWERLLSCKPDLNAENKPFFRYARQNSLFANCQVILRAALRKACMPAPDLKLAQTGWTEKPERDINFSL